MSDSRESLLTASPAGSHADVAERASDLLRLHERMIGRRTDRVLGLLLLAEWVGAVLVAWFLRTPERVASWLALPNLSAVALLLGGAIAISARAIARARQGASSLCQQSLRELHAEAHGRAAEQANRVKTEFLANMSHEIRTPMTAIQGYADLMLDPSLGAQERLEYAVTIRRNSEHLLRLLNDILDLSKMEAGKMTIESARCSPAQIVVDVASLIRVRAKEKSLAFGVVFATPVPATITSDPTRLRQILMNLAGNAIKFTQTGSVRIFVRCEGEGGPAPRITFEVADTGIGLSREQMEALFRPFTQADSSTTRRFGGTGLGLSICKRLANVLGGDITVESLVGRGSSFTLSLPTGALAGVPMITGLQEGGRESVLPLSTVARAPDLSARVLLAEDGHDNQVLIATHLRRAGVIVEVVENGRSAVDRAMEALADGEAFDLIYMDMQMPVLDGYAATAELRNQGYTGAIVALTAHAMEGDREACIAAGCDEYLTKPIDRARLVGTVERFVRTSRAQIESADTIVAGSFVTPLRDGPLVSEVASDPAMADLLGDFLRVLGMRADALLAALRQDDMATVRRTVHQIKGAAGGYGFPSITDQAKKVEAALSTGERAAIKRELNALCSLLYRAAMGAPTETAAVA
jgi:signal transduction histidine kinase/CheY-like chemotaxis protein/HPt (histidine-containing phosphotransfer) domain-containing protein